MGEVAADGADATAAAATARSQSVLYFSHRVKSLVSALDIDYAPATVDTVADTADTAASTRQTHRLAVQDHQGCPMSLVHHSCCHSLLLDSSKYRLVLATKAVQNLPTTLFVTCL